MKKITSLVSLTTSILCLAVLAGSAGAAPAVSSVAVQHGGLREHSHLRNGTSTNWSGYAVETSLTSPQSGVVTDVSAKWVVPQVVCANRSTNYSSAWVGIDGYSDNTVEQTGTEMDCNRGHAQYYAWYEFYPQSELLINTVGVHAGDTMSGDVSYVGNNQFKVTVTDITTNQSYSTTRTMNSAKRQSAEWIAEAPSSWYGVLPLSNFGSMSFTNASATLNGTTGTINSWPNDPLTMVTNGGQPKAVLSNLLPDGSGYTVTWKHS